MFDHRPDWLTADSYPFTVRTIELDDSSVRYVDEGDGPTVLFVHAGMWSFVFRDVIDLLRARFRCITLDFPGYGLSPEPDRAQSLADLSFVFEQFVQALDLREVTLVAHDLGGAVSVSAAGRDPERYTGLVLSNTFIWPRDGRGLRTMLGVVGSRALTALGTATNLVPRLTSGRSGVGRHLSDDDKRAFLGPFRDRSRRRRFHTAVRSARTEVGPFAEAQQAAVGPLRHLPVLSIFGEKNDPFGFQPRIAPMFTDHEGIVIEAGNHFPMMDDPDRFADTLGHWHRRKVSVEVPATPAETGSS